MDAQPISGRRVSALRGARPATAFLSLGVFALFSGLIAFLPFWLSPLAIQNDVYLNNAAMIVLAAPVAVIGLIVGAIFLGRAPGWLTRRGLALRAILLALVGAAIVGGVYLLFGEHYYSYPPESVQWPLYVGGAVALVALALCVVEFVAGWLWGARMTSDQ